MSELTFFQQLRADGGERTGIDLDGHLLMQYYRQETGEYDPALLWYVDVRCEGDRLPEDPQAAREWFLANGDFFVGHLTQVADELAGAGFDVGFRPLQRDLTGAPDGVRARIVISAIRRLQALDIADKVRHLAGEWTTLLDRLAPLSVV